MTDLVLLSLCNVLVGVTQEIFFAKILHNLI